MPGVSCDEAGRRDGETDSGGERRRLALDMLFKSRREMLGVSCDEEGEGGGGETDSEGERRRLVLDFDLKSCILMAER